MKILQKKSNRLYWYRLVLISICFFHAATLFGQSVIKGRIVDHVDKKTIPNASIFLGNTTIGIETGADGHFTLSKVKDGKYVLIVSVVGFQAYSQTLTVNGTEIDLPDIELIRQVKTLAEVTIRYKEDPNRGLYYQMFKTQFLGTSDLADDCVILNPEILDLRFDEKTRVLTASSTDFLKIENRALGYKLNYLITNFTDNNMDTSKHEVHFAGTVLFEDMKGTAGQERRWQKRRQEVYEGSEMHFLRAAATGRIDDEGFRLFQFTIHQNPERPSDSVIVAKIKLAKKLRSAHRRYSDSVSFWEAKMHETKVIRELLPYALNRNEVISETEFTNRFAFGCNMDALCVVYSKNHHFPEKVHLYRMYDKTNHERTLINFYAPYLFFENNGWVINPDACSFIGAWEKYRVAGLLPLDYEPAKATTSN